MCVLVCQRPLRGPVLLPNICLMYYKMCLFMHCTTDPSHPSLSLLMAVTAIRSHWRAVACVPWWGTASAETAWLTMPTVEKNSMRTVHLSENIPDPSTEALLVSPMDPALSLHKAMLQLKLSTSNPFKILFKFIFHGIKYSLNCQIYGGGLKCAEVFTAGRRRDWNGKNRPTIHISVKTMWVFVHTLREWPVSFECFMILLMIIKIFLYLSAKIFCGTHWFSSFTKGRR